MKAVLCLVLAVWAVGVVHATPHSPSQLEDALAQAQRLLQRDGHLLQGPMPSLAELRSQPIKPPAPPPPSAGAAPEAAAAAPASPVVSSPQGHGDMVLVPSSMAGTPDASGLVLPAMVPGGVVTPHTPGADPKLAVDPQLLTTPVIREPKKVTPPEPAPEKPFVPPDNWAAAAMAERRNPSDHLIQQTIAGIKKVESHDVGELAPGLKLGYEHTYTNKGLKEAHVERPSLMSKEAGPDAGLKYLGVDRERLGNDGPQKKVVGSALLKMGHVVNDLAKRVAQVDTLEEQLMRKVMGGQPKGLQGHAKEEEMIHERAEAHRLKRETEVAALVRNEVQILTDQIHTELRALKTKFFAQLKDTLHGLREHLQTEFLRQHEHQEKMERIAEGKFKANARQNLDEENLVSPARMKARLDLDISRRINEAFNRMASIRKTIVVKNMANGAEGAHVAPDKRAEETAAMLSTRRGEPTTEDMKAALEKAAEEERKNAAKDANPRATAKEDGEQAEAIGDAAAEALKLDEVSRKTEKQAADEQEDDDNAVHNKERALIGELAALRAEDNAQGAEQAAEKLKKGEDVEKRNADTTTAAVEQMEKEKVKEEIKNLAKGSFLQEGEEEEEPAQDGPDAIAQQLKRMWQRRAHQ